MVTYYRVEYAAPVENDLRALRPFDRAFVMNAIERRLPHLPARETRHQKKLSGRIAPFEDVEPVWQLSVGAIRVFYDVDEGERRVTVLAVKRKPPHKTTKDIL